MARIRGTGETGEIKYSKDIVPPLSATEYFHQNCWMGVSGPGPADIEARHAVGIERFMWGSDYPHDEGTHPHTREHLRRRFADLDDTEVRMMLSENAAKLYDFDLDALGRLAVEFGPTVEELHTPVDADERQQLPELSADMDAEAL